jgi:hypothetical protein
MVRVDNDWLGDVIGRLRIGGGIACFKSSFYFYVPASRAGR